MQTVVMLILLFLSGSFVENASASVIEIGSSGQGDRIGVEDTSKAEQLAGEPDPSHLPPGGVTNQSDGGSSEDLPMLPSGGFSERGHFSKTIDSISDSKWFGLLSGFASIVALLLALWGSQVRALPFSFYRSLVSRRVLLLSLGGGFVVWAGVTFYNQELPPPGNLFVYFHAFLRGRDPYEYMGAGPALSIFIFILGVIAIVIALFYDPLVKIRVRLSEERKELQTSLASELSQLFGQRTYEELSTYDKAIYRDLMDYYGELQSRLIDVLLGSSISPGYRRGLIGRTSLIELLNSKALSAENEEKR